MIIVECIALKMYINTHFKKAINKFLTQKAREKTQE